MIEENASTDEEKIALAEDCLQKGLLDKAQSVLNSVKKESSKKFFIQSKIYKEMKWYNEQRKQLKAAIKAEPKNELYKREMQEFKDFTNSFEYKEYKREVKKVKLGQMGGACLDGCFSGCFGCSI